MKTFLIYLILGIADGSVYAIAGLGLVLTFKTSGIFNFAHGAQAAAAAYLMYTFRTQQGLPWPIAALLAVLIAGVLGGLLLERLANLLSGESTATRVVAMVGILVGLEALLTGIYGGATIPFASFLPQKTIGIAGVDFTVFQIIVTALALAAAGGLWILFRRARIGTAMQAVVDDPALLDLLGTSPARVRRFAWVLGSCFASVSGLLLATYLGLNIDELTLLVIFSFGAAAVGAFSNLPLTYVGGLAIGIGQAMTQGYLAKYSAFQEIPANVPFIILVIALLVAPTRTLVERGSRVIRAQEPLVAFRRSTVITGGTILLVGLCAVPFVVGYDLPIWSTGMAFVIIFASLGLLVRTSGQVSLCQITFAAIGSSTFALAASHHVPWAFALLIGGLAAVPIGAAVALPAMRLRGVFLAVTTLGFGVLVERVFYSTFFMFGASDSLNVPRPKLGFLNFTSDRAYYFLTLAITLAACGLVMAVRRGRLGRMLQALSESPALLQANGASANLTKLYVFCISAFLAGIGGALLGGVTQATGGLSFDFSVSLIMVAVLFVAGRHPILSAFIAAGLYNVAVTYIKNQTVQNYSGVVFGVAALIVATRIVPIIVHRVNNTPRAAERLENIPTLGVQQPTAKVSAGVSLPDLELTHVSVRFGGLHAVDDVSLRGAAGRITGLIGPNGAGKTTTFNACAGVVSTSSGSIRLGGRPLDGLTTAHRAQAGLGRTFQRVELIDVATVRDNVALGAEALIAGRHPWGQLMGSHRVRAEVLRSADREIERCGLSEVAAVPVSQLSTGQCRLVELARAFSAEYKFLLLDEPSSGLDKAETEHFGEIVKSAVAERSLGVLLVEHDMALIRQLCTYIYVLDFGQLIYEGESAEVLASPVVRDAYLGTQQVA